MKTKVLTLSLVALFLVSCGGKKEKKQEVKETETEVVSDKAVTSGEEAEKTSLEEGSSTNSEEVKLEIIGTDQMKFNTSELRVKEGQKVTLTLKHDGKQPVTAMGHNWVLLKGGTDIAKFAEKAMAAKDKQYIPTGDEVIANTGLVGGGNSTTVTFNAPAKGTYDYICSFPGHYGMMKGKFIVE